jgi:phosphoribosylamine--glycine ligase
MRVLIIGGGAREHALAWKCASSPNVEQVFVAPGNAGTAMEYKTKNLNISADDTDALLAAARHEAIDLTIVGPEAPLAAGVVDLFQAAGQRCFGPSKAAARLEASKIFTKEFLTRHAIPTAAYETFTDVALAERYIRSRGVPIVVKADGLAAGKGVTVARTHEQAVQVVAQMLSGAAFGAAGRRVLIEDCLVGEEASFIVMVDGEHVVPLASSQDHKARDDGDLGPNTGGMGAYSPAPVVDAVVHDRIMREVIMPTVQGMAAEGAPFVGFLYAGLMIDSNSTPNVIEFNCRLGDPETQPVLMRLRSDLVALCDSAIDGKLDAVTVNWDARPALGVVMAAGGYPDNYAKGHVITGLEHVNGDAKVFHAGTDCQGGQVVTTGGRVLCVCALGDTISAAQQAAYQRVNQIEWPDCFFRTDIGHRATTRD